MTIATKIIAASILFTNIQLGNSNIPTIKNNTLVKVHLTNQHLNKKPILIRIINDLTFGTIGGEEFKIFPNGSGDYIWSSSSIKKTVLFSLEIDNFGMIDHIIEPNDNISILYTGDGQLGEIKESELKFSGRGSKKFLAMNKLNHIKPLKFTNSSTLNQFNDEYIRRKLQLNDSIYHNKKNILDSFKNTISNDAYNIMDAEIYGKSFYGLFNMLEFKYSSFKESRKMIHNLISLLENSHYSNSSKASLQSRSYLIYLMAKSKALAIIKNPEAKITYLNIYNELVTQNSGEAREKILVNFLLIGGFGSKDISARDYVFADALNYIKNPHYHKMIYNMSKRLSAGSVAYPFKLSDTSGNKISLYDFKGKTIILDCWFTGCFSCKQLAQNLDKNVIPIFQNNKNVVFISVCVDKNKSSWIESIKNGEYTSGKSINLYTEGKGLNHPFIKNYNFDSFPQLLLIDKTGRIYSSTLPRDSTEMIGLIDNAINSE